MSAIGKVVLASLGLIILYDLLKLSSSQPGVLPGAAGTFGNFVHHIVSPGTPLVPYAPGYGPQAVTAAINPATDPTGSAAGIAGFRIPSALPPLAPATPIQTGGPLGQGLLLPQKG